MRAELPDRKELEGLIRWGHARLPDTLSLGPEVWRVLAKCHNIRNLGEYEGDLNVDDRIVTDLVAACQAVAKNVDALTPLK